MTTSTGTDRRSPAKHKAILRAATEVFLREGYSRASVDQIAATAEVGKQTVYGHFGNKQKLFLAVVEEAQHAVGVSPEGLTTLIDGTADARTSLETAGERLLRATLAPDVSALHRLTIAELTHHPELQRSWRDEGASEAIIEAIAHFFTERARRGELEVADAHVSARQFIMLLSAEGQVRSLRGVHPLSDEEFREISRTTADLFLRAHRPGPAPA